MKGSDARLERDLNRERYQLLRQLDRMLEGPMVVLGFVWLGLLVLELTAGLGQALQMAGKVIWGIFVVDFAVKLVIAPQRGRFLRQQWLTALSLAVPALRTLRFARVARVLRAAKAARGARFLKLLASMNRGLRALRASMARRGISYVAGLGALVTLAGAAGIHAFEGANDPRLRSFAGALWWSAMMMTTVGSDIFPQTPEGRLLCVLMAAVAFALWGYVTATLATFFVGRDADNERGELPSAKAVEELRAEVRELHRLLRERTGGDPSG
jgi:voltage-gated potassium channel